MIRRAVVNESAAHNAASKLAQLRMHGSHGVREMITESVAGRLAL